MGDIASHGQVTTHVVEQMKKVAAPGMIPEADYSYLELGNFITDVAQFRDPVAWHKARERVRDEARAAAGAGTAVVPVDRWANDMFGVASRGARHGRVPEFLRVIAYAFTHHVFDPDGLSEQAKKAKKAPFGPGLPAALVPPHPIEPAEVERVLAARFDQYWPHDHVDFPPMKYGPRHQQEQLFKPYKTGLITFLEGYLQYLSEELSKLEFEWVQARQTTVGEQLLRDFLVRLGNLLHAVEDLFFHSNLAEVRQWQVLRRKFRQVDPATDEGRKLLFKKGLYGTALNQTSVRLRRILFRRLRYPVFVPDGSPQEPWELSRRTSEDGTELLFTGGFGETDVYHTLGGALEAIEELASMFAGQHDPAKSHLVLVRLTFNEYARRAVRGDEKELEKLREEHAKQLGNDEYPKSIDALRQQGNLSKGAAERLKQAFQLDRREQERGGPIKSMFLPGPGGFLINLLEQLQTERTNADLLADMFDGKPASITDDRSQNGASTENVGTHSLLSKDSPSKQPFRADAVALAAHASAGVATTLVRRLENPVPVAQGIDWDAVLRFYVRFPKHPSGRWEEQLITMLRQAGPNFKQPDVDDLAEQPTFPLLGPPGGAQAKLEQRRAGKLRARFEEYYRSFETDPP
jgi:hypothetical protein